MKKNKPTTNSAKHNLNPTSATTKAPQKKKPRHKGHTLPTTPTPTVTKPPMTGKATDKASTGKAETAKEPVTGLGESSNKRKQVQLTLDRNITNVKPSKLNHPLGKPPMATKPAKPTTATTILGDSPPPTNNPYYKAALSQTDQQWHSKIHSIEPQGVQGTL